MLPAKAELCKIATVTGMWVLSAQGFALTGASALFIRWSIKRVKFV